MEKQLIKSYLENPNQTLRQLADKFGYSNPPKVSYWITKYFKMNLEERKSFLYET